ncbi:hypothetical protein EGR_05107 [Echinococcus granulosus]|uniref:Uncharacterized protein n=1 Tax=Echinococcus granulosus TaxID=6210 RepID=W6UG58_ECHGR|nr:hypothetical protein EGR_05107 [Echinococcus granulosus]EUB59946.1 hypothetical protein EGR_05107 [Echinococcus granulosus]
MPDRDTNRMSKCRLLCIQPEGADDVKKQQLMELAIINGTYRDPQHHHSRHPTISTTATSSQHSSPSPLSPSFIFDDFENKERQQAQVQQMTQQQQHHFLLQQQYLSMLSSQSAIAAAAALAHNPAAQLLAPAGLRFGAPTASTHPSTAAAAAAAAANPLFLGTNPTPTPATASTPSAAVAAMNLAAVVMGGVPAISPVTSTATATAPIGGAISSDQLAALLGVANGAVSPNSAASSEASGQSMAAIAAGFPGTFPSLLPCTSANPSNPTTGTIIGSYSNAGDLENNSALQSLPYACTLICDSNLTSSSFISQDWSILIFCLLHCVHANDSDEMTRDHQRPLHETVVVVIYVLLALPSLPCTRYI